MGRRQKRTQIGGQFAARLIEMLESPAYRALSLSAHRVLSRLEVEFGHHGGTNNGCLPVTFADFEHYGIHRHAISPAIRECVALGFLEVTEAGRAGNAEFRSPNKFRITYRHTDSLGPTDEWRRIETEEQANTIAVTARRTFPSAGKRQRSVSKAITEKGLGPVPETITTGHGAETITTSISRAGVPTTSKLCTPPTVTTQLIEVMRQKDARARRAPKGVQASERRRRGAA